MSFSIWPSSATLTISIANKQVVSVVDLVDWAVMIIFITDSLLLSFQQLLGLLSAWSINFQVPALPRRSDTFTMPRLGTVSTSYMVAVMERRTTSSLKRSALRPAFKGQGPCGKTGGRAKEEGKGWGKRWSSGDLTPFTLHSVLLLTTARRLQCPVKPTLSEFSRERMAEGQPQRPLCGHLSLITCSSFLDGSTDSATLQSSLQCSWVPSGLENSSPSCCHWAMGTMVPYFLESLGSSMMNGVQVWATMMALSRFFIFAEDMWRVIPRNSEVWEGSLQDWVVAASETVQSSRSSFLPYPPQQNLPISSPPWVYVPYFCLTPLALSFMRSVLPFILSN